MEIFIIISISILALILVFTDKSGECNKNCSQGRKCNCSGINVLSK